MSVDHKKTKIEASIALAAQLYPQPGKRHVLRKPLATEPTLSNKVYAATQLSVFGIHHMGISAQAIIMWPLTEFNEDDVIRVAAKILASVQTALLSKLLPQEIDSIWKDQEEYLSFACGSE